MKIKEIDINNRPRERLINNGVEALSNSEILAILLNSGSKEYSAVELAEHILKKYSLNELIYLSYEELIKIPGIKSAKATKIIAAFELAKRAIRLNDNKINLNNPKNIWTFLKADYLYQKTEKIIILILDSKLNLIKKINLNEGISYNVNLNIRNLITLLIKYDAYGFIICHNHPSNDSTPSKEDKKNTQYLNKLTKELDILLLDHIIWAKDNYFSFLENNLLDFND